MNPEIFIPEIELYDTINILIDFVRADLKQNASTLQKSYLYKLFGEKTYNKFNLFTQGRSILSKENQNKRFLEVCIGYNLQRAASPTIHIVIPSESKGSTDSLGFGEGEEENYMSNNNEIRLSRKRSFNCQYNLLMSSDNMGEILFIHHLIKNLLIGTHEQLDLKGFENLQLTSQDITLQQDIMPMNIYHRILGISFNYETVAPSLEKYGILKDLLSTGKPYETNAVSGVN